ncbi:mycothiol acetyltransferase [Gandjariella thermophila]|uniref:Mycothiol acetyltransferase n=1 Tax=Gandjariella thermophila TaxID=1931992 RepID=A0A4D4JA30_9PSEU|nr:mycothiol acetyltransferase [Gandjariella thermophila]
MVWRDELPGEESAQVSALLEAAEAADGVAPVGEPARSRISGGPGGAHLLAFADERLAGYAALDVVGDAGGRQVAELAVHPELRRRGVGAALLAALVERVAPGESDAERLRVWAHGTLPGAARLAERAGLRKVRELLRMRRLLDDTLPEAPLPGGVRLRTFVPGRDESAVVYVNHRAFAWHPEQSAMTVEDLRRREGESWFDPNGFLLAVDADDRLLGFHWTKVHPDVGGEPFGEVYVVGVDPDAQGGGLGRSLTVAGLRHLRDIGQRQVMLYVEGDNAPAVAVYIRLGFRVWDVDTQFAR